MPVADVYLRNFQAGAGPRMGHTEGYANQLILRGHGVRSRLRCRGNRQVLVSKTGVRQAVAKGKERLDSRLVEMTISNKHAFGVFNLVLAWFWVVAIMDGIVVPAPLN